MNKYALLLKTGESELRAIQHFPHKSGLLPIVELTRGRTSKNDKIGFISKKIDKICDYFNGLDVILDLTSEPALSNSEIDLLYQPINGYENWTKFLSSLKEKNQLENIYPTLILSVDDPYFNKNLGLQVKKISSMFKGFAYRCNIEDEGYIEDLNIIQRNVEKVSHFFFIIDCSFIRLSEVKNCMEKAKKIIAEISPLFSNMQIIMISTSFPDKIGDEDHAFLKLLELDLYNDVSRAFPYLDLIYGDYGSINPIRNDNIIMANGWRPRIDTPLQNEIFYYRRRKNLTYSRTYSSVAKDSICDEKFPYEAKDNWGITQILNAADGASPGSSPSFWISVRMNVHIEQQLRRLNLFRD